MNAAIAPQARQPVCSLCALMAFDRERSLEELQEFVADLELDDRKGSLAAWHRFAQRLTQRVEIEEQLLLPPFAVACPEDAARLIAEHQTLRTTLRRLGANLELHLLRAEHLRELLRLLRVDSQHAHPLYKWAELNLDRETQQQLLHAVQRQAEDYAASQALT